MGWVDMVVLGILGVSVLVGVMRGLVFELLSLLGWIAAWFAAQWLAPWIAPYLPIGQAGSALNHGAAFAVGFIAALLLWGLAAQLVRMLMRASPLSPVDRVLGAGFGLLRGLVVLLVITTVVGLTPMGRSPAWQQSYASVWLNEALQGLKPALPPEVLRHLPA